MAIYDKFILQSEAAFSSRIMYIQGGDIAMSLGLFSMAIALYFWQKTQRKQSALCILAALFGIFGQYSFYRAWRMAGVTHHLDCITLDISP